MLLTLAYFGKKSKSSCKGDGQECPSYTKLAVDKLREHLMRIDRNK